MLAVQLYHPYGFFIEGRRYQEMPKSQLVYFYPYSLHQIYSIYQVNILSYNHIIMYLLRLCCGSQNPQKADLPPRQINPKNNKVPSIEPKSQINLFSNFNSRSSGLQASSKAQSKPNRRSNKYQGQKTNDLPNGKGTMLYANGDFYRGQWVNGVKEGRGLQIYNELKYQYEGQWKNDKYDGFGKLLLQNASYFMGQFKDGVKHGKGQFHDMQKKKQFSECYQMGVLKQQKQVVLSHSHEQEYATLNFDKERFNSHDLINFQRQNPKIKQLDVAFLLKYHNLTKLTKMQFIDRNIKEWGIKEVLDFLQEIGIHNYKQIFYRNKIKGKHLVTLKESELKQDLKMKLGDRKRLITILKYFTDTHQDDLAKQQVTRQNNAKQKYLSIKTEIYKQSIMEQQMESDRESKVFLNEEGDIKDEQVMVESNSKSVQSHKYLSAAQHINAPDNCEERYASIEKRMEPLSERTEEHLSSSKRDIPRKNSRDIEQFNYFYGGHLPQTFHKLSAQQESLNQIQRYSQREPPQPQLLPNSGNTSQTNSSQQMMNLRLQRNPTFQRSNKLQTSQIRQLYDFLKQHRSLSFIIKQKDIEQIELIGRGGFGKVYRGKYIGQQIAIKDFLKTGKRHEQDFMKQLQIISDLKHPNIVLYMGICITANKYTLITQYLQNGSLFDQLHKKKKKFTEVEKRSIAYDIVKGMVYLHNMKKILHRDLKSSNVLIGQNWQVKLCDFGLSGQKKNISSKNKSRIGTYQWMAPEVMRNQDLIDQYADVYSFGVIIWELLSQKIPFEGFSQQQMIGLVGYDCDYLFEEPEGSPFLKSIMRKCLNRDPKHRPTFIEIQKSFQETLLLKQKSISGQHAA